MADIKIKKPTTKKKVAKVPVVMQLEVLECGAASLAMVLAYYGKWIPLEQVRKDCGVSRDGSSAGNVIKAARNYGLNASGYKMEPETLKSEGTFPCIVHWEFNHFVVCDGFKNGKVYLNDPARGTCVVSEEQFDESFTGVVLLFEPSEEFVPSGKPKSTLSFARKRLKGASVAVAFVIITTIISSLFGIINPALSRIFLDRLLSGRNPEWFTPFLIALIALSLIEIVVAWMNQIYSLKINGKLAAVGNSSYMWKVLHLPMDFFSQRMAGDIQQRQNTNASIAANLVETIAPIGLKTIMMIFYLVVMIRYSIPLTIIGLLSIIINFGVSRIIASKRINLTRVMMRDAGKLYGTAVSGIEMIETIKASGAENGFFEKWSGYQASVNSSNVNFIKLNQRIGLIPVVVSTLLNDVVLVLGIFLIINGEFSAGALMAFQGFLASFEAPANELIDASATIQEMRAEMERVEDVMEYPDDPIAVDNSVISEETDYSKLLGEVELKNITFGYSALAQPFIKNFNLKVKPGSRVAIVGSSGSGKSTISKLLSGLYSPWEGEILFDGKPREDYDRSVITGSLAVVDQNIILFEDTIANNIRLWDQSIADFEVIMAARDAHLHEDIMMRDGGYNYRITEGGKDFSGGQRQRMEIARVLAQDPTIIILDEATSALDAKTENEVVKAIVNRGITCIVVAHRLSTIRDCDEIIVMDHGEVIERGTHEELYAKNGYYTKLVCSE